MATTYTPPPLRPSVRPNRNARRRDLSERIAAFADGYTQRTPAATALPAMPSVNLSLLALDSARITHRRLMALQRSAARGASAARRRTAFIRWQATANVFMERTGALRIETERAMYSSQSGQLHTATSNPRTSPATVRRAVRAMVGQFENLRITADKITVKSPPVVLEGVEFGEFDIELRCPTNTRARPRMRFIALDPVAPHSRTFDPDVERNSLYHHPHIRSGELCEGSDDDPAAARPRITRCLDAGAIPELFDLLIMCLQSYNRHSPYLALDYWRMGRCARSGEPTPEISLTNCARCQVRVSTTHRATCYMCAEIVCSTNGDHAYECSTNVQARRDEGGTQRARVLCSHPECRARHERLNPPDTIIEQTPPPPTERTAEDESTTRETTTTEACSATEAAEAAEAAERRQTHQSMESVWGSIEA